MSAGVEKRSLDITATLHVELAEARDGAKKRVEVTRIVRCSRCFATYRSGPGCDDCDGGLATRDEALTVTVPSGVAHGAELRLAGKGHESSRDDTGDLFLTISLPKPAEAEPTKATPAKAPASAWQRFRSDPGTKAALILVACVAVPMALLFGAKAYERASLPELGALCAKSTDCGSGLCMELYARDEVVFFPGHAPFRGLPKKTGGVCSRECSDDSECPATMTCAPASRSTHYANLPDFGLGPGEPNTKACAPRPPASAP